MRADVSDEAEKDGTGEARLGDEEDVPKRTVIEDGSVKPNGIATSRPLAEGSAQLELPISSEDGLVERARAIVDSLDKLTSEEVFAAFEELDQLPSDVVRAALESATGPAPDPERLDDATRRAHGFPARALRLRTVAVTKDADIFDLGDVVEQQLRLAGKAWDGRDLEPEERLDGEIEDSFAGTLEHHVLVDAERPGAGPLFDVLRYAGDAGTIFRAGTTEIVGAIAYGVVEMNDRRSRLAIQEVLDRPFEAETPVAAVAEEEPGLEPAPLAEVEEVEEAPSVSIPPKKKAAASAKKKAAAAPKKKAAAASKKAAAAPKKASAKKTATKKTAAAKTPSAKKTSATKAGAKKATAKKPASTKKTTGD